MSKLIVLFSASFLTIAIYAAETTAARVVIKKLGTNSLHQAVGLTRVLAPCAGFSDTDKCAELLVLPTRVNVPGSDQEREVNGSVVLRCNGIDDNGILEAANAARKPVIVPRDTICAGRDVTLSVPMKIARGGLLKPITGHWIKVASDFEVGPYQVFTNALTGQGTITFVGNPTLTAISPDWWGAARSGSADDGAPIQAAFNAIRDMGRGQLVFTSSGNYKINSTVVLQALNTNIDQPIILSGYGAVITVNTTATPGLQIRNVAAGRAFVRWIIEGLTFVGTGTESAIISVMNSGATNTYDWKIEDVNIQGTRGHGIHVDSSSASPGSGGFQFQIENCHIDLGASNQTGVGILLDGVGGTVSSADLNYNTVYHGLHGIQSKSGSVHITGGTIGNQWQEGIFVQVSSGWINGVHVEGAWQSVAAGQGGGEIYIEGWCDIAGLEEYRSATAGARWAIDISSWGGPTNILGRRFTKQNSASPYARVRNADRTGVVNLMGIEPGEVDASLPTACNTPTVNYFGGVDGTLFRSSCGASLSNSGLFSQKEGPALAVINNAIAPSSSIHHVGAGLIRNLVVPAGFGDGAIYLIPDASFTTDAKGNIATVSTAIVGRVMVATYSSSSKKWYLSY